MTSPGISKPDPTNDKYDDVYGRGSSFGQDLDPSNVRSMLMKKDRQNFDWSFDMFHEALGNVFNAVGNAIAELLFPNRVAGTWQEKIKDGQLDIINRTDLLEGVQGYGAAYQTKNINVGNGSGGWRDIPFNKPLGPSKNITIDEARGELVFGGEGLHVVYTKVYANDSVFSGNDSVFLDINILYPDRSVYSWGRTIKHVPRGGAQSVSSTYPVVVPGPGYRVQVKVYSSNWRWFKGGTQFSTLHVIRHSSTAINPGEQVVPDE